MDKNTAQEKGARNNCGKDSIESGRVPQRYKSSICAASNTKIKTLYYVLFMNMVRFAKKCLEVRPGFIDEVHVTLGLPVMHVNDLKPMQYVKYNNLVN